MATRSRRSLGGLALRDGASRHNSLARRRRQSFGGDTKDEETTPQKPRRGLLDSTFGDGHRPSSVSRRQSFGGDALRSETPIRDRRAMLEAWRQARAGQNTDDNETKKRVRNDPPLPPSMAFTPNGKDRGYSRKVQRTHGGGLSQESDGYSISQNTQSANNYDEGSEMMSRSGASLLTSHTPLSRRSKLGSARRKSMSGRKILQTFEGT